jgi:hypothetical protein
MTSRYQVIIQNAIGETKEVISAFESLQFARSFNNVGTLSLVTPDYFEWGQITRDWRVLVYRSVDDHTQYLEGNTFFLARKVTWSDDNRTWTIKCDDALSIVKRRIVAYTPETPYADKTFEEFQNKLSPPRDLLPADDMIKEYVRQN